MLSPSETGTTLGATPGNVQGAGRPAPHTGTWHRRGARRQQSRATGRAWRGEAGQGPPSHTWGALSDSALQNVSFQDRHAGSRRNTSRDDPVHGGEHRRGPHAAAPRPKAVGAEAADARRRPDPRHPGPALLHELIAPGREPRVRTTGSVTQVPPAACQRAKRTAYLLTVHKHVDDLCATALSLCMRGGNAGDSAARPHTRGGLYLGKRRPHPVHAKKTEIVHMLRRNR
jgi:hypothetical protein